MRPPPENTGDPLTTSQPLLLEKRGLGGYSVYADPDVLRYVASVFRGAATGMRSNAAYFEAAATLPRSAFGYFSSGPRAWQQYDQARQGAAEGLRQLAEEFASIAQGLDASAQNYDGADIASSPR